MKDQIQKIFKNREFVGLVLVAILFLGYSFLSTLISNRSKRTSLDQNPSLNQLQIKITFSKDFSLPKPKEPLKIYEATIESIPIATVGANLAEKLGLDPGTTFEGLWQSPDKSRNIIANKLNNNVHYYVNFFDKPNNFTGPNTPTLESAIKSAAEFSQLLENFPPLDTDKQLVRFYKVGSGEYVSSNQENYDVISIPLIQHVDSVPVKIADSSSPIITINIGQSSQVVKAFISPYFIKTLSTIGHPPLLDQNSVEKNILQGQIIQIDPGPEIIIQPADLNQAEIESASLEYRYSYLKRLLIPSYNLQAKVITKNNVITNANIIIPAVKVP